MTKRPNDNSSPNDRNPRPRVAIDPNAPIILPTRNQNAQQAMPAAAGNFNHNNAAALHHAPQNIARPAPRAAVIEDDQVHQNPNLVILPRKNPNEITDPLTVAAIINNLRAAGREEDSQRLASGDAFLEQITNRETGARELRIVNRIEQAPANVVAAQGGNQVANNGNQQGGQGNGNAL